MNRETYSQLLHDYLKNAYVNTLGLKDYEKRIQSRLKHVRGNEVIEELQKHVSLEGKNFLEVGSGRGEICIEAARNGAQVFGVEPEEESLVLSRLLAEIETMKVQFLQGYGEALPFKDHTFDLIVCHEVLEHVQDPAKTISEMIRVLKPGGALYLEAPNYLYPYEGHYKVYFPPLCPKWLGSLYLKARGRNPDFLKSIQYITARHVLSELKKYPVKVRNLSLERQQENPSKNPLRQMVRWILKKLQAYPYIELWIEAKPCNGNI